MPITDREHKSTGAELDKHRLAFIIIAILLVLWYVGSQEEEEKIESSIHSSYFFNNSKSLGQNAVAIVLTVDQRLRNHEIRLIGIDEEGKKTSSRATVSLESDVKDQHFVTALIQANLKVNHLKKLKMEVNDDVFEVPFRSIDSSRPRHPVVFCVAPQVISENWQHFVAQIHIARHFGAHVHMYLSRVIEPFFELLQEYEKREFISVQPWLHHSRATDGAAFTDCLLQYKDRARYVAFVEFNEILIPSGADSYFEEYLREFGGHRLISSLYYPEYRMKTKIPASWNGYSFDNLIRDGEIKMGRNLGRLVVRTDMFNSTGSRYSANANTRMNLRITKRVSNGVIRLKQAGARKLHRAMPSAILRNFPLLSDGLLDAIETHWNRLKKSSVFQTLEGNLPRHPIFSNTLKKCMTTFSHGYAVPPRRIEMHRFPRHHENTTFPVESNSLYIIG
ncbi:unnamed protein product [Caenorhabditis sp. 36 PRJEB53466]|nr:unnamed protein product [Caenorhabditis sp. 36 PRJEB53466]